ncbi:hypothetical protein WMF30_40265 [Sorangium sp. So ce134]
MTEPADPPVANAEPTIRDRYLVAAYLLHRYALKNDALDRGHRGEVEALIADGPLDVELYNQRWSSRPGVFGRNLERAREWLRSWSDTRPSPEPAPNPVRALFGGADPRLADGVDPAAAAVAIEVAATQLAGAVVGGPSASEDATPRVVRVRDAAISLARAAVLGARALVDTRPPSQASLGTGVEAAVEKFITSVTRLRPDGLEGMFPYDPSDPGAAYRQAIDATSALVRAVVAAAAARSPAERGPATPERDMGWTGAGNTAFFGPPTYRANGAMRMAAVELAWTLVGGAAACPPDDPAVVALATPLIRFARSIAELGAVPPERQDDGQASPEQVYQRAIAREADAERSYRRAREATDRARDELLSTRARQVYADEEKRIRELIIHQAERAGLDGGVGPSRG